jgi:hypothetical protein
VSFGAPTHARPAASTSAADALPRNDRYWASGGSVSTRACASVTIRAMVAPQCPWATWVESMSDQERREVLTQITGLRRLLTGTLHPHLIREPDNLEVHSMIAQVKGLTTALDEALHREL